jgi:hypothetical protein
MAPDEIHSASKKMLSEEAHNVLDLLCDDVVILVVSHLSVVTETNCL